MRTLGSIIIALSIVMGICMFSSPIVTTYKFEKKFKCYWELADKSSTIQAKDKYIAQFISVIESNKDEFAMNDAIFMKTPNNSFDQNLDALKTLGTRLGEISKMDVKSFEYNTAIQQITAQEQGEAGEMISVLFGCWLLANYPIYWGWIAFLLFLACVVGICVGGIICSMAD